MSNVNHILTQLLKNPLIHCYFIVSVIVFIALILWTDMHCVI